MSNNIFYIKYKLKVFSPSKKIKIASHQNNLKKKAELTGISILTHKNRCEHTKTAENTQK